MAKVSRLRVRAAAILKAAMPWLDIRPEHIHPVSGWWKQADVYRWELKTEALVRGKNTQYGCWETLTEFVALASKYGFTVHDDKYEIWPNEAPTEKE